MPPTDKSVWDQEVPVPIRVIQYIDQGVRDKLPPGTQFHDIVASGASYWARTAKINATDAAGEESPFFIKVHQHEQGKSMVSCEYEAMKLLYSIIPEMVAEPMAWGAYTEEPAIYFFVCRFRELSDDIPPVSNFPALLAEFHKHSASDKGEFGFPLTMYAGRNPQHFPLTKSWEETFSKGLKKIFDMEEVTQGPNDEMRQLREGLFSQVIPRLLRPLESEGRVLVPTLVHGDLWDGNASVDVNTGQPVIYDATPLYAHNEYEMGPWWAPRHKMKGEYITAYSSHYNKTEPVDDFEDRGALYRLRFDLHASSLYPGKLRFRELAIDTMRDLLKKYPFGYAGYLAEKNVETAQRKMTNTASLGGGL